MRQNMVRSGRLRKREPAFLDQTLAAVGKAGAV